MALNVVAGDDTTFDYVYVPISDIEVKMTQPQGQSKSAKNLPVVDHLLVNDEQVQPTTRFWSSLFARFGFNNAFFNYFSHEEVFQRISQAKGNDRLRICIERTPRETRLLAVSNPTASVVSFDQLIELMEQYGGDNVSYSDGIVESDHIPRNSGGSFKISGDDFQNHFVLSCPIDGYGKPNVYLSMLRDVCQNGLVGYSKVFKSQIALGKGGDDIGPSLCRVLEGFGNEEGYAALRQRVDIASKSQASVYETVQLQNMLFKMHQQKLVLNNIGEALAECTTLYKWFENGKQVHNWVGTDAQVLGIPLFRAFEAMSGNPTRMYGLANIDALSDKRKRTLPTKCTVYDLVNFATEVATHHALPEAARKLQAWVGELVSAEYDLEGTKSKVDDFQGVFIGDDDSFSDSNSVMEDVILEDSEPVLS